MARHQSGGTNQTDQCQYQTNVVSSVILLFVCRHHFLSPTFSVWRRLLETLLMTTARGLITRHLCSVLGTCEDELFGECAVRVSHLYVIARLDLLACLLAYKYGLWVLLIIPGLLCFSIDQDHRAVIKVFTSDNQFLPENDAIIIVGGIAAKS